MPTVIREFDMRTREFVAGGYELPEAKTDISWESADSVLVGTDFGPGSLTDSGYPRIVKRWRRGQPLAEATTLFTGEPSDVSVGAGYDPTPGYERLFIARSFDFFNRERYELRGEELIRIDVPDRRRDVGAPRVAVDPAAHRLVAGFHHVPGGLAAGRQLRRIPLRDSINLAVVFEPDAHTSLESFSWTRDRLILLTLVDVASRVEIATPGTWQREPVPGIPPNTNTVIVDVDEYGDEIFVDSSGFDTPSRLLWGHAGDEVDGDQERPGVLRRVRHRGHPALRRLRRRHHDPVLRCRAS